MARKHLGWYLDRHAGEGKSPARTALMTATNPTDVLQLIAQIFGVPAASLETEPDRSAA